MILERVFGGTPFGLKATRSWRRSLAKTITWRLFATADTFVISVLITGNLRWAGSIVGIEFLTKMAWYFLHERAWAYARAGVVPAHSRQAAPASAPLIVEPDELPPPQHELGTVKTSRLLAFDGRQEDRPWSGPSPFRSHKPNVNHRDAIFSK